MVRRQTPLNAKIEIFVSLAQTHPHTLATSVPCTRQIESGTLRLSGILMMRERTRIRIARAVALDLEGLKGPEIARRLGMKPKGLESLRARAEYKEQLASMGNEMIRRMDEAVYKSRVELMLHESHTRP